MVMCLMEHRHSFWSIKSTTSYKIEPVILTRLRDHMHPIHGDNERFVEANFHQN